MSSLLVLDLDDTLYPERDYVLSGFAAVGQWIRRGFGVTGFEAAATAAFYAGVRGNTFEVVLAELGAPVSPGVIASMVEVYRNHVPRITLFEDAAWCLDHFRSTCEIAILTDGYLGSQQAKVGALGLSTWAGTIVYSDELGRDRWKPSPAPYVEVMRRTGRESADCIYVSDNPAKDFVTAKALGWTTIRIRRPGGIYAALDADPPYSAHVDITSLYDLPGAIGMAMGKQSRAPAPTRIRANP